jgi:hypothetical protein
MVFFEIQKYKSYQASCEVKYFQVTSYEWGKQKYGKYYADARRMSRGHFCGGTLTHPEQRLDGCVKLFRRPDTTLAALKAYLEPKGDVIMNKKLKVGIRKNARKKEEALALKARN